MATRFLITVVETGPFDEKYLIVNGEPFVCRVVKDLPFNWGLNQPHDRVYTDVYNIWGSKISCCPLSEVPPRLFHQKQGQWCELPTIRMETSWYLYTPPAEVDAELPRSVTECVTHIYFGTEESESYGTLIPLEDSGDYKWRDFHEK